MKILLIVASRARKGPVLVARDIVAGLAASGHVVEVWYLDDKGPLDFACPTHKFEWSLLRRLKEFDVVHSHSLRPDALSWVMRQVFRHRARYVTTLHNYVEQDLRFEYGPVVSAVFSRIWRFLWQGCDACVALTHHARDYYLATQPQLKMQVVYNGRPAHKTERLNVADAGTLSNLKRRYGIIGATALVTERKGLDQIIRALPNLPEYVLVLIGEGPGLADLKYLAVQLDVAERFICLGFRDNARDFLPYMDIYAMPSRSEGMPLAMLEAVDSGVPVVCSEIPVFQELFADDEVAFFELDDATSLEHAVRTAADRAVLQSQKAQRRFEAFYSLEAMAQGYLRVYGAAPHTDAAGPVSC